MIIINLNIDYQAIRRFSKSYSKTNIFRHIAPHDTISVALFFSSNAHLIAIPATTAMIHYLYKFNHIKKATLYFDMQKLGKNDNYVAKFQKVREILQIASQLDLFFEQKKFDEDCEDR